MFLKLNFFIEIFVIFVFSSTLVVYCKLSLFKPEEKLKYRDLVRSMFYEAYDAYMYYASDYDELMPISCSGVNTWGTFSLSMIDALDMLVILNNHTEFRRVAQKIIDTADFETNKNVSVFETNIRVVGGLLSAHLFSKRAGFQVEAGWPCSGPLLRLAEKVATKLLPAFDTKTGMPYGTVNFEYGVPENETPVTCTAGVGTFIVEFGALSRLTGNPIFEQKALRAIEALQKFRSKIGLLGNHIDVQSGKWLAADAGIGAGVDSYFEYLVKGAMMLQMPYLMEIFYYDYELIKNYIKKSDWFLWVSMTTGATTMPIFQSLEAFFPGLLTLIGEFDQAKKSLYNYHQVWKQYGFMPEFYDIVHGRHHKRQGYPLRPEFIESVFYLYRATKDPHLLSIGADAFHSIFHSARTECGFASIKSVSDHTIEDRMESFFLSETLKYLYLLFDEDNFINDHGQQGTIVHHLVPSTAETKTCVIESGGYVFNTEAHPIDIAALSCCHSSHLQNHDFKKFEDEIDLTNLFSFKKISDLSNFKKFIEEKHFAKSHSESESESSLSNQNQGNESDYDNEDNIFELQNSDSNKNSDNLSLNTRSIDEKDSIIIEEVLDEKFSNDLNSNLEISDIDKFSSSQIKSTKIIPLKSLSSERVDNQPSNFFESNSSTISNVSLPIKINIDIENYQKFFEQFLKRKNYNEKLEPIIEKFEQIDCDNNDEIDHESLTCPSQPFLMRLSMYGQMFNFDLE